MDGLPTASHSVAAVFIIGIWAQRVSQISVFCKKPQPTDLHRKVLHIVPLHWGTVPMSGSAHRTQLLSCLSHIRSIDLRRGQNLQLHFSFLSDRWENSSKCVTHSVIHSAPFL